MEKKKKWLTNYISQEKLTEEYVKSLDDKRLIIVFKKTTIDSINYSKRQYKTCHINVFGVTFDMAYSEVKKEYGKVLHKEEHIHMSDNKGIVKEEMEEDNRELSTIVLDIQKLYDWGENQ